MVAVPLFQALGLDAIPGFLVAGMVLEPSGLGFIRDYNEIDKCTRHLVDSYFR